MRRRQDAALQQVGRLPVQHERRGRRPAGPRRALPVEVHGLGRQRLIAAEPVQDRTQRRHRSGHRGGALQILVRSHAVLLVDAHRLLPVDPETALPADQQHVGDLRVHVVQREIQIGGGENLRLGLMPDQLQAAGDAPEDRGGNGPEHDGHDYRRPGHRADAGRPGQQT
jgi:hypothetical protein